MHLKDFFSPDCIKLGLESTTKDEILRKNARRYLADASYRFLVGQPQSVKIRQVLKGTGVEGATTRLVRQVMAESDRFETVDRRWSTSVREY